MLFLLIIRGSKLTLSKKKVMGHLVFNHLSVFEADLYKDH